MCQRCSAAVFAQQALRPPHCRGLAVHARWLAGGGSSRLHNRAHTHTLSHTHLRYIPPCVASICPMDVLLLRIHRSPPERARSCRIANFACARRASFPPASGEQFSKWPYIVYVPPPTPSHVSVERGTHTLEVATRDRLSKTRILRAHVWPCQMRTPRVVFGWLACVERDLVTRRGIFQTYIRESCKDNSGVECVCVCVLRECSRVDNVENV